MVSSQLEPLAYKAKAGVDPDVKGIPCTPSFLFLETPTLRPDFIFLRFCKMTDFEKDYAAKWKQDGAKDDPAPNISEMFSLYSTPLQSFAQVNISKEDMQIENLDSILLKAEYNHYQYLSEQDKNQFADD